MNVNCPECDKPMESLYENHYRCTNNKCDNFGFLIGHISIEELKDNIIEVEANIEVEDGTPFMTSLPRIKKHKVRGGE